MQELRCDHKLFGILLDSNTLEVKCQSRFCGHERGTVALHRFDLRDGTLIETKVYKNPILRKE